MLNIEKTSRRSVALFDSGWYCAESVLMAVAEAHEIQSESIPSIATGFCSGLSKTGGPCGAVTGGIMALGLLSGRSGPESAVDLPYRLVQEFLDTFIARFGSVDCKTLIGCDLGTEAGQRLFEKNQLMVQCRSFVGEAASMVMDILNENRSLIENRKKEGL